jgi:hypothetical protein
MILRRMEPGDGRLCSGYWGWKCRKGSGSVFRLGEVLFHRPVVPHGAVGSVEQQGLGGG